MLYAKDSGGRKVRATPLARAYCPNCGTKVLAKCGEINVWHWAHKGADQCDSWADRESDWHRHWKSLMPPEQVEIVIEKNGERHVADIVTKDGIIIELQSSHISPIEIEEREQFYDRMVWLFDVSEAVSSGRLRLRGLRNEYQTFRWQHPRKHIAYTTRTTWLDLDPSFGDVFLLKKMYANTPCGGWGYLESKLTLLKQWEVA